MAFQKENTQEKIIEIISKELTIPKENILPTSSFKDLGADSLDIASIIMNFEDAFGVEIKDEDAVKIATIQDAIDLIHEARTK